jgi:hypothetical protein
MPHLILAAVLWLVCCLVIAAFGARYRFGFWGYFFGSVILSPLIGLLLLLAAIPPRRVLPPQPREKVTS